MYIDSDEKMRGLSDFTKLVASDYRNVQRHCKKVLGKPYLAYCIRRVASLLWRNCKMLFQNKGQPLLKDAHCLKI